MSLEEDPEISGSIMSKRVRGFSQPRLALQGFLSKERIPLQVELRRARAAYKVTIASMRSSEDPYTFALNDVIVEHRSDLVGKEECAVIDHEIYRYTYLQTYVVLGIPTERYNWFIEQAQELKGCTIQSDSLATSDGYTWIVAETYSNIVGCYIYDNSTGEMKCIGSLDEKIQISTRTLSVLDTCEYQ